jgi:head-tail adaptor
MQAGELRHRVTLKNPSAPVADGDGSYVPQTWTGFAIRIPALVQPATVRNMERLVASTVQSHASHLVTIRYRPSVSTQTRVVYHDRSGDRTFSVTGVSDTEAAHVGLVLVCDEVVT